MAWRFGSYHYVKDGFLDNRTLGKTVGEITFAVVGPVKFRLKGDMQGVLKGRRVEFENPKYDPKFIFNHGPYTSTATQYMDGFARTQRGDVGDIRCEPYLYIEWYSKPNWRCVIELDRTSCVVRE